MKKQEYYLRFSLITLKQVQYHATARNSIETKQQRIEYGEFFLQNKNLNFVFIDEVGYSISVQRNRGRAPKRKNGIAKTPLSKTPNTRVEGTWVVGGVEKTPERRIFAVPVEGRSADTIE